MAKIIDLRSDTVTQPTAEMRAAMAAAPVGDDVYRDDPTVLRLEELAARMLGKEAAMFTASGTMGNQLAIMTHTRRGDEVICGARSHIVHHEVGAMAVLSGVMARTIDTPDDQLTPALVEAAIRPDDIHQPRTGLIEVENALAGGTVVPLERMREIYALAQARQIPVHLDGARIFNAAWALGVDAAEIAACADSVMCCLSKGLCAPVGSILAGPADFIECARKNRKILGGGMRQAGILAAAGIIGLEKMTRRLGEDHENARYFAERLAALPGVRLDPARVQISMVFFEIERPGFDHDGFVRAFADAGIRINPADADGYRFVTHHGVDRADIDRVIREMAARLA